MISPNPQLQIAQVSGGGQIPLDQVQTPPAPLLTGARFRQVAFVPGNHTAGQSVPLIGNDASDVKVGDFVIFVSNISGSGSHVLSDCFEKVITVDGNILCTADVTTDPYQADVLILKKASS